jgi:integrase
MHTKDMKYLKLKGGVYIYNRHVPKQYKDAFKATAINRSLKTDSYKEAVRARDQMNVWFNKKCRAETSNPRFFEYLKDYQGLTKEQAYDASVWWDHEIGDNYSHVGHPEWDGVNPPPMPEKAELTYLGIQKARGKEVAIPDKYRLTLKNCLLKVLEEKQGISDKGLSKYKRATEVFHQFIGRDQQYAYALSRGIARKFITEMKKQAEEKTIKGWLSNLSTLWKYARDLEELETANPFTDWASQFSATPRRKKKYYQNWKIENLRKIVKHSANDQDKLMIYIAWFTGSRLDEIFTIRPENILEEEKTGIKYLAIKEDTAGKNEYAERHTPIKKELEKMLEGFNGFNSRPSSDAYGKAFGRAKRNAGFAALGKKYAFHSIRGNASTNLENLECPEHIANQITGHAPSDTMTYGYYSEGVTLEIKNKYVQQLPIL